MALETNLLERRVMRELRKNPKLNKRNDLVNLAKFLAGSTEHLRGNFGSEMLNLVRRNNFCKTLLELKYVKPDDFR